MRGDVLLWTSDGGLPSRLFELTTRGPYCHVSADLGDGTDIGARSEDGAQRHHVSDDRGITKVRSSTLASVTAASIEKGVRFLEGESALSTAGTIWPTTCWPCCTFRTVPHHTLLNIG